MSLVNTNYAGYELKKSENNDIPLKISEVMELFSNYISSLDDAVTPKDKITILIDDFLIDQNIPTNKVINEDEKKLLESMIKAVESWKNEKI